MLKKFFSKVCLVSLVGIICGCASSPEPSPKNNTNIQQLVLATPLQISFEAQRALAELGARLASGEYTQEAVAQLYYERGLVYDQVGLRALAHFDFNRALQLKPDFAQAYNFLGVYATMAEEFDNAFENFDSAIELAPDYSFAYFYRATALNYANRAELAVTDINTYADTDLSDPYRVVWRYLIARDIDPVNAKVDLQNSVADYAKADDWGWDLARYYVGELNADQLLAQNVNIANNRLLAERLCEAYFYLAKQAQFNGDHEQAVSLFKLALSGNVYDFVEHRFSLLELNRYYRQAQTQSTSI